MKPIQLTKKDFLKKIFNYEENPQELNYTGDKPAIVEFYASWCPVCQGFAPRYEEIAEEYDGNIYFYKVEVDEEKELAAAFGVESIPTLLFVPLKETPQVMHGAVAKEKFEQAIEDVLKVKKQ